MISNEGRINTAVIRFTRINGSKERFSCLSVGVKKEILLLHLYPNEI